MKNQRKKTTEKSDKPVPGLKFKITNLRTSAYPGPLVETDMAKIKIDDFMTKGSGNTVYEVVHIGREAISQPTIDGWLTRTNLVDLAKEYKKNGNYGACFVSLRPVIRNDKIIGKGRLVKFCEIDNWRYKTITLQGLINTRMGNLHTINKYINKYTRKKDIQQKALGALLDFRTFKQTAEEKQKVQEEFVKFLNEPEVIETTIEVSEKPKCGGCGKNDGTERPHSCPYQCEINEDFTENCNCCENCQYECAMDI